jgi:uncharacterized repeat protein (TIGR03803 family)
MRLLCFPALSRLNFTKINWGGRGCALLLFYAIAIISLPAQTFTTLQSFDGTDGVQPTAGLVQGTDGNLYGTTSRGGKYDDSKTPGNVFKITPSGKLTNVFSFDGPDGDYVYAGLVQDTNGDFYGTTYLGGDDNWGTVFRITPNGSLTTLQNLDLTTGKFPWAGLIQATDGDLYGTTTEGGANNGGTVFKITPSGTLTTLFSFCVPSVCTGGLHPFSGLVQAQDGDFYGTTFYGGTNTHGTIFKITPSGTLTTVYNFCSQSDCTDGANPWSGLIQANDGNFYGTTYYGGIGGVNGGGTVFKITPSGTLTTLHAFCVHHCSEPGSNPMGGLIQATDGNCYGTTSTDASTIFKITPSGTLTTLYIFCLSTFCANGVNGEGTVYRLSVGLGPFVETQIPYGEIGAAVNILGTDLTGATSVKFNGTAAAFKVVSSSLITTTVPSGATTGKVEVVTPGGTLSSNRDFRVAP